MSHDARTCCAEHARAGAGLPAIEPGMPTPAGTGLSRRSFLLRSAGLALAVYGAGRLPAFEEGIARAQSGADPRFQYGRAGANANTLNAPMAAAK